MGLGASFAGRGAGAASVGADLTVTVVSWNTSELLRACLSSLLADAAGRNVEIHVVDNVSTDGSPKMVRAEFPCVRLIENKENVGFARANNQSWSESSGRYWMLLNPDTIVRPGALSALVRFIDARPRAGLATARVVNPDGTPQFCAQPEPGVGLTLLEAARLHKLLPRGARGRLLLSSYLDYKEPVRLGWAWGTALIARREAVEDVGALAEGFFMYGEDVEWGLRMRRKGWEVWLCPEAEVVHYGGRSAMQAWSDSKRERIIQDSIYRAVEQHRGRAYVGALHAARWLAASLEDARAMLFRTAPRRFAAPSAYHREALRKLLRGDAAVDS